MKGLKLKRAGLVAELKKLDREIEFAKRPSWDRDADRSLFDQWAEHEGIAPLTAEAEAAAAGWKAARDHWRSTEFLSRDDVKKYRGSEFQHTGTEGTLALFENDDAGGCSSSPFMSLDAWTVHTSHQYHDASHGLSVTGHLADGGAALRFVTYLTRMIHYKGPPEELPRFPGTVVANLVYGDVSIMGELKGLKETSHRCPEQADYEKGERRVYSCTFVFQEWRKIC